MWRDPIVEEVRKARDEYARRFNYDLAAIVRDVQARQKTGGAKIVDRSADPGKETPAVRRSTSRKTPHELPKRKKRKPTRRRP